MKKTIQVLKPTYYDKFHCIGGACEMNCCDRDWGIYVDKKTYLKYRDIKQPEIKGMVDGYIKREREGATIYRYARITQDENRRCPFHMEDGLCIIQKELGEEYLCNTCQKFPRLLSRMQETIAEYALSMSCPEAVRVALVDTEPMGFELNAQELTDQELFAMKAMNLDILRNTSGYAAHGWALREASIDIMQNRDYSVEMRLLIIGMLMRRVTELGKAEKWEDIPNAIDLFMGGAQSGEFHNMQDFTLDDEIKRHIHQVFCSMLLGLFEQNQNNIFMEAIVASTGKLPEGETVHVTSDFLETVYARKKADFWPGFLAKYSHVLENYLVNFFFSKLFPIDVANEMNPYQFFCAVAEQFAVLRMILCLLSEQGEIDRKSLELTITSVAVKGENGTAFREFNREVYEAMQVESLAHMYFTVLDN